jgi:tetratricopeptide (TPR) repeat protein
MQFRPRFSYILSLLCIGLFIGCGNQQLSRGESFIKVGMYKEALLQLDSAIQKDPQSVKAHFLMGIANLNNDQFSIATQSFMRATKLNPKYSSKIAFAYFQLAQPLLSKDYCIDKPLYLYKQSIETDSTYKKKVDIDLRTRLLSAFAAKDYKSINCLLQNVRNYDLILDKQPLYIIADSLFSFGIMESKLGNSSNLTMHFSNAFYLNPTFADTNLSYNLALGDYFAVVGQYAKAENLYESISTKYSSIQLGRKYLLLREGNVWRVYFQSDTITLDIPANKTVMYQSSEEIKYFEPMDGAYCKLPFGSTYRSPGSLKLQAPKGTVLLVSIF